MLFHRSPDWLVTTSLHIFVCVVVDRPSIHFKIWDNFWLEQCYVIFSPLHRSGAAPDLLWCLFWQMNPWPWRNYIHNKLTLYIGPEHSGHTSFATALADWWVGPRSLCILVLFALTWTNGAAQKELLELRKGYPARTLRSAQVSVTIHTGFKGTKSPGVDNISRLL